MIIAHLNQKGGVGKTTISVNVARYFNKFYGKTILVDSDPQASARDWYQASNQELLQVIGMDRPTIHKDIQVVKHYDWIFIDGAPRLEDISISIIECSDLIIIPLTPSPYDVWAMGDLIELIKRQIKLRPELKCAFLISMKKPNTTLGTDVKDLLSEYGFYILPYGTSHRTQYALTTAKGSTVVDNQQDKKATTEIHDISHSIMDFITDKAVAI